VDLEALAREALALSEPLARERGLRLEARLQPLRVRTHRDRALQVLLNLLANALRHARSRVVLELRAEAGEARFRVVDDGPGVPEALREHIFAPFQSYAGGTGLGLAIARRLSEALGGRVFLEDGEGGVFVFALPLEGDHGRGADRGR
jgi:signal transduction histidine kinase